MRDEQNIRQVASFAPDYMGFISYSPSPRFVGEDFKIPEDLPSSIGRVGVFVNETTQRILESSRALGFDHVQLHGNEPAQQASELKDLGFKVIKVFSIDDNFLFNATKPFVSVTDFFLFDTKGKYHGGNAKTFNWGILKHYDQEVPFFLSGGLSADNIAELDSLNGMNLYGLDLNSGVEESPALKSVTKLNSFFDALNKIKLKRTI